jgi:hypothetical protein
MRFDKPWPEIKMEIATTSAQLTRLHINYLINIKGVSKSITAHQPKWREQINQQPKVVGDIVQSITAHQPKSRRVYSNT